MVLCDSEQVTYPLWARVFSSVNMMLMRVVFSQVWTHEIWLLEQTGVEEQGVTHQRELGSGSPPGLRWGTPFPKKRQGRWGLDLQTGLGGALWVGNKWTGKKIPLHRNVWGGDGEVAGSPPSTSQPCSLD